MARLLILVALAAITFTVMGPGPDVAAPVNAAPSQISLLPSLEPISLGIGLLAGIVIGWVWQLPWHNLSELLRGLAVRSLRGFGLIGLAMGAAAVLLFY